MLNNRKRSNVQQHFCVCRRMYPKLLQKQINFFERNSRLFPHTKKKKKTILRTCWAPTMTRQSTISESMALPGRTGATMIHCSRSLACRAVNIGFGSAVCCAVAVPSAAPGSGSGSASRFVACRGNRSITQRRRDERDSVYAPVPGTSSGRTRVSARQDTVCVVDVDVDVDAGVKVDGPGVWETSSSSSEDDAVKLEIFGVACEETVGIVGIVDGGLDWAAPAGKGKGEDFGFVNANRLFGFSFAFRIATLLSSSVICY